jgi:hypothetical protein
MRIFLAFAFIAMFAYACSSSEPQETVDSTAVCKSKPLNPNGDSELAILMREMANWTDSCKAAILSDRPVPEAPEHLSSLTTAKRTDETIDAALFNSLATLYQGQVVAFNNATADNRKALFNSMVAACAGCHKNFCQGPLVRINKMIVQ